MGRIRRFIMIKEQKTIGIIIIAVSVALAVIGYIILPDMLVVQLHADGSAGNTFAKPFGLLIPFAMSVIFSLFYMKSDGHERYKHLVISIVGIAMYVFIFIVNLSA